MANDTTKVGTIAGFLRISEGLPVAPNIRRADETYKRVLRKDGAVVLVKKKNLVRH